MSHWSRLAYYLAVLGVLVIANLDWPAALIGTSAADLLRRNSEAYAMALLVPLFWDLIATAPAPHGRSPRPVAPNLGRNIAWFGSVAVGLVLLQSDLLSGLGMSLPQAVVTLGEAFTAAAVVTGYLTWSRSLVASQPRTISGLATSPAGPRAAYYVMVIAMAVFVEQTMASAVLGEAVTDWLRLQSEAFAAMVLVPLYFDAVATSGRPLVRIGWYAGLVAVPLLVQGGPLDGVLFEPLRFWIGTTTEAFVATLVTSAYFDVWHRRS